MLFTTLNETLRLYNSLIYIEPKTIKYTSTWFYWSNKICLYNVLNVKGIVVSSPKFRLKKFNTIFTNKRIVKRSDIYIKKKKKF